MNSPESFILSLNRDAISLINSQKFEQAFSKLSKAKEILWRKKLDKNLWSITYSNFGCYYKKIQKPKEALNYLILALEKSTPDNIANIVGTHLNISSIYSELGKHEKALSHALKSLNLLNSISESIKNKENLWVTVVVTYHCIGLEYGHLSRKKESMQFCTKGHEIAKLHLGIKHQLTKSLKKSLFSELEENYNEKFIKKARNSPKFFHRNLKTIKPQRLSPLSSHRLNFTISKPKKLLSKTPENHTKKLLLDYSTLQNQSLRCSPEHIRSIFTASANKSRHSSLPQNHQYSLNQSQKYDCLNLLESEDFSEISLSNSPDFSTQNASKIKQTNFSNKWYRNTNKVRKIKAAITIQRWWKRYKALKKIKIRIYNKKIKEAQIKAKNAFGELEKLRKEKENLAIKYNRYSNQQLKPIPCASKTYEDINILKTITEYSMEDQRDSINIINPYIKMWINKIRYQRLRKNAIIIQKNYRMHKVKNIYKSILAAAIYIQSYYRGHRTRKLYKFLLK